MQNFVENNFDSSILKRLPLFNLVTFCLNPHYQTGGMGYELVKILPDTPGLLSAEVWNKLTETKILFKIPISNTQPIKINGFIETKMLAASKDSSSLNFNDTELLKRLDICLEKMYQNEEFSGTVLLAKNDTILLSKAIGEANKDFLIPNNTDTKFNLASVGKIFTSMAIVQLVEQGKLSFENALIDYLPEGWLKSEVSRKIKIKHLLTHTSGLGDYFGIANKQCDIAWFRNLDDYKSLILNDTLLFKPGTSFSYSNTGYLLLGLVIEKISGEKYFDYLKNHIFTPAGMGATDGFEKDRVVKNRAIGYTKTFENESITWNNHQTSRFLKGNPSGGIYSTTEDLLKFVMAIKSNKLLSPEYSKLLFTGHPELHASFHSYVFFLNNGSAGLEASHAGDGGGVNCHFKMYVDRGYSYVILSNYSPPSANIVKNVIDQLISHKTLK